MNPLNCHNHRLLARPCLIQRITSGKAAVLLIMLLLAAGYAYGQSEAATASQPTSASVPPPASEYYGAWVLVPPMVAIVLAIFFRQVLPALTIGILVAAYMLVPCQPPPVDAVGGSAIWGLRLAVEKYLFEALAPLDKGAIEYTHLKIIVFTFMIGGTVGVMAANGGTRAAVERISRWASTRERGQLATWFAGLVVFFDDYANAMIVGPAMRPISDRLRISRAKLAYIVDSTAAPVSSIALIGTWVGAEISFIQDGLNEIAAGTAPAFMDGMTGYRAFLASIPYRTYALLALVMVFVVGILGRDFGPMRRAEQDAADAGSGDDADVSGDEHGAVGRAWYAVVPVSVLVFLTLALLVVTGWPAGGIASIPASPEMPQWLNLSAAVLASADATNSILYGALGALLVAIGISLATRVISLAKCVEAATDTMARMMPTMVVLVLAWALSASMNDLMLGEVARTLLQQQKFNPIWLPLLVFVSSCVVSFATGTSWGTMGILCPATVTVAASLLADTPADAALPLFYASVGAVLAGSVFGDHCSPISDTTVLSSLASECSLEQHVWTQLPYAITVAIVSILCGDIMCRYYGQPLWLGLLAGVVALVVIVLIIGRKPRAAEASAA